MRAARKGVETDRENNLGSSTVDASSRHSDVGQATEPRRVHSPCGRASETSSKIHIQSAHRPSPTPQGAFRAFRGAMRSKPLHAAAGLPPSTGHHPAVTTPPYTVFPWSKHNAQASRGSTLKCTPCLASLAVNQFDCSSKASNGLWDPHNAGVSITVAKTNAESGDSGRGHRRRGARGVRGR